jgi:hypothetical protein
VHLPTFVSLGIIALVIAGAIAASVRADARERRSSAADAEPPLLEGADSGPADD